jgi:peroxiredoxin
MVTGRKLGTICAVSAILLFLLATAANIYLASYRAHVKHSLSVANEVQPGAKIDHLSGLNFDNNPLIVDSGSEALVLLVYSPMCPYCERNWPAWQRAISSFAEKGTRFVSIDVSGTATSAFLRSKGVSSLTAFHRIDNATIKKLKITATPETILIDRNGSVKDVWLGVLDSDDSAQLSREMK